MSYQLPATAKRIPSPWPFFGLTFLISWGAWAPMALLHVDNILLFLLGGFGPSFAALILLYRTRDPEYRRDFWRRLYDPRRVTPGGWLLIVMVFPLVYLLSIVLSGRSLDLAIVRDTLLSPAIVGTVVFGVIAGPLAEEPGWRGVGLDRLQARYSWITASIILGFFWALWHLPVYWLPIEGVPVPAKDTAAFWLVAIGLNRFVGEISGTFLYVWVANRYRRSILAAIVLHFLSNNVPELFGHLADLNDYQPYVVLVQCVLVLGLLIGGRAIDSLAPKAKPA